MVSFSVPGRIKSVKEVEAYWPGFSKVWAIVKAECAWPGKRCPTSVRFSDEASPMYPNDDSCAQRFAVELASGKVLSAAHVSCGDWAGLNKGQEGSFPDVPAGVALVSCEWSRHHGFFSLDVQVAPGTLPAQLGKVV